MADAFIARVLKGQQALNEKVKERSKRQFATLSNSRGSNDEASRSGQRGSTEPHFVTFSDVNGIIHEEDINSLRFLSNS